MAYGDPTNRRHSAKRRRRLPPRLPSLAALFITGDR